MNFMEVYLKEASFFFNVYTQNTTEPVLCEVVCKLLSRATKGKVIPD